MLLSLFKNLIILLILAGIIIGATKFIPTLKKQTGNQIAKVLGAKSSAGEPQDALADSLQHDAKQQVEKAKETALHLNLSDLINTVNRLQKIPRDLSAVGKGISDIVSQVATQK